MTHGRVLRLALIIVVAAGIRLWGLWDQGLFMHDEGAYLLQARNWLEHLSWLAANLPRLITGAPLLPFSWYPPVREFAKPGHVFLLMLAGAQVRSGLLLMSGFGLASLVLVAAIARRADGDPTSLLPEWSVLLLALSPAHVHYSRALLGEIDALFFLLLAVWFYLGPSSPSRLVAVGLCAGIALLVQIRLLGYLPFFLLWEIAVRRSWPRLRSLALGFVLPFLLVELVLHAGLALFALLDVPAYFTSYVDQFLVRMAGENSGGVGFHQPLFAARYLGLVEGLPTLALALVGLVLAARRRSPPFLLLGGFLLWSAAVGTFYQLERYPWLRVGRMVFPAVPFLALLAAWPLDLLWRRSRLLAAALAILVLAVRLPLLHDVATMRSDYAAIFREVDARSPRPIISDYAPLGMTAFADPYRVLWPWPGVPPGTYLLFERAYYTEQFPHFSTLPDTPTYRVPRRLRASPLLLLEGVTDPGFTLTTPSYPPAEVFEPLPPPDSALAQNSISHEDL